MMTNLQVLNVLLLFAAENESGSLHIGAGIVAVAVVATAILIPVFVNMNKRKKDREYCLYLTGLADSGNVEELKRHYNALKGEAMKDASWMMRFETAVKALTVVSWRRAFKLPPAERSRAIDELVRSMVQNDILVKYIPLFLNFLQEEGSDVLAETVTKLRSALSRSEKPYCRQYAKELASFERACNLKGTRLTLEGVYPDGVEFDWNAYRGTPTLFFVWSMKSDECVAAIPRIQELERRYAGKMKILGFNLDDSPAAITRFEREYSITWDSICRLATLNSRKASGGKYIDPCVFYGMTCAPVVLLVDANGIVVDPDAFQELESKVAAMMSGAAARS